MKNLLSILLALLTLGIGRAQEFATEKKITDADKEIEGQQMHLVVTDASTGQPKSARLRVSGIGRKALEIKAVSDTMIEINTYRLLSVSCAEKGYMFYSEKFWPDEKDIHNQNVTLKPLEVGLKSEVRDVVFKGDDTEIYGKSEEALMELVRWMQLNPEVRLAVIGHVNGPDNAKSAKFYQAASLKRAKAVVKWMETSGVEKTRLEARGAGNSEMLYPKPKTDWESDANRRIQIEVIGL